MVCTVRVTRQTFAPPGTLKETAGDRASVAGGGKKCKIGWTLLQGFLTDPTGLEIGLEVI